MGAKANHHYVPQFYLRNFANGVGRKARVVFFDEEERKFTPTLVRNIGSTRYFNRVDADGVDPDHIEDALAKLESEMTFPLAEVIEARSFPSDEHFTYVMNLAALLSVRNPRMRGQMEKFHQDVAQKVLDMLVSSEEVWEHNTQRMKVDGVELSGDVTYESVKRFRNEKRYTIEIDRTHLIGLEFEVVPSVLDTLARRYWCFATAPSGSQYITSDNPVCLEWSDNRDYGPFSAPAHGRRETSLVFPISSEVVLIGTFEDAPQRIVHDEAQVTSVNTIVARHSRRQIYARDGDFRLHLKHHRDVRGSDLPTLFGR
jgi:hypothetical protein